MSNQKYIISEFYDFKADRETILESEKKGDLITLVGILQKADELNRNGRVYPYDILKREVEKYMEEVENNRAYGELDHPDCVLGSDSKILTKEGWKFIKDISEDEIVLTFNEEKGKIEEQQIEKKIAQKYKGKGYRFKGRNIDETVTPNHRFLLQNDSGKYFYKTAEELYKYRSNKWKIPKKGEWEGKNYEYFTLEGISKEKLSKNLHNETREKYSKDISIKSEDWFAFLGIYLADGSAIGTDGSERKSYMVKITQNEGEKANHIRELIKNFPKEIKWNEIKYKDSNKIDFIFHDKRIHNYLFPLGNSHSKYIPQEIKEASSDLLTILWDWFLMGDGRNVKTGDKKQYTKKTVFSTSKQLIYDLHEILFKSGGHGNISIEEPKDRIIYDEKEVEKEIDVDGELQLVKEKVKVPRLIKESNSKSKYYLNYSSTDYIYLDKRSLEIEEVEIDDYVYCVRVPNSNFYVMVNNKSHWTGNSAVVSLVNVSHMVVDMWWEGRYLYGKVVVFDENPAGQVLKGIIKKGGVLGISSRGVGSVQSKDGNDVVQDDFELIAFDFVSSPSTPGSYMFKEGQEKGKKGLIKLSDGDSEITKVSEGEFNNQLEYYKNLNEKLKNPFWQNI